MDSGGNEKRIQALFSELSLEEQSSVPQFAHVWARAQVVRTPEARRFGRTTTVWISVLVTAAACSFAVWSWYRFTPSPLPKAVNPVITEVPRQTQSTPISQPEKVQPRRHKTIARGRQTERLITTNAAMLSTWQSPTQSFMTSPVSLVPSSLPQLNQSVKELESFLPKNNEIMKESNQ